LELHDVHKSKEAFAALYANEELRNKFADGRHATDDSKALFAAAPNCNFWDEAERVLDLLLPICDLIHHIENDKPVLSQVRRVWQKNWENSYDWICKYRRPAGTPLPYSWNAAFGTPPPECVPAADVQLVSAIRHRFNESSHPCFTLAAILDLRFLTAKEEAGISNAKFTQYIQSCNFLTNGSENGGADRNPDSEVGKAFALAARMVGEDNAEAVFAELDEWMTNGTLEDMARMIQVSTNCSWKYVKTASDVRLVWRAVLSKKYPLLAGLAQRLFSMHATACSSERLWSQMRWVYSDSRSRLGIQKAKKMVFISGCQRLKRRLEDEDDDDDGLELMLECILREEQALLEAGEIVEVVEVENT